MTDYIAAIDQGTTSTRCILFDHVGRIVSQAQQEHRQIFPQPGWVEHDALEIWHNTQAVIRQAVDAGGAGGAIAAVGITNQRETVVLWDRKSGEVLHNALVWQDRRTADACAKMREQGLEKLVTAKTGLLLDPYFSASKLAWLLDEVDDVRQKAEAGEICAGTIECFLLWRLTGGALHATDISNASRTMLFNIHECTWDEELLRLFGNIPMAILPEVLPTAFDFGKCQADHFGVEVPISGMIGDQQSATFGQCCFAPGMLKSTYGTGNFVLINTGSEALPSANRMLTTIAWQIGEEVSYAIEGAAFSAGSTMQWLRDGLELFPNAADSESLAQETDPEHRVYLVPAFTGLGAPWWDPHARASITGITRDTKRADIARAGLEAVCFQTRDLLEAMIADGAERPAALRVDGGMVANSWAMQFLADILDIPVERPAITETTALGAAAMAGLQVGFWESEQELAEQWQLDARFEPKMDDAERAERYAGWRTAVNRTLT